MIGVKTSFRSCTWVTANKALPGLFAKCGRREARTEGQRRYSDPVTSQRLTCHVAHSLHRAATASLTQYTPAKPDMNDQTSSSSADSLHAHELARSPKFPLNGVEHALPAGEVYLEHGNIRIGRGPGRRPLIRR